MKAADMMTKRAWDALPGHVRRDLALARWAARPRRKAATMAPMVRDRCRPLADHDSREVA